MCDCQVETSAINCRNSDISFKIADKRIKATLAVGRQGSLATLDNALSRTADFGLKREAAEKIIQEMIEEIKIHWQEEHKKAGVPEEKLSTLHHS